MPRFVIARGISGIGSPNRNGFPATQVTPVAGMNDPVMVESA